MSDTGVVEGCGEWASDAGVANPELKQSPAAVERNSRRVVSVGLGMGGSAVRCRGDDKRCLLKQGTDWLQDDVRLAFSSPGGAERRLHRSVQLVHEALDSANLESCPLRASQQTIRFGIIHENLTLGVPPQRSTQSQ